MTLVIRRGFVYGMAVIDEVGRGFEVEAEAIALQSDPGAPGGPAIRRKDPAGNQTSLAQAELKRLIALHAFADRRDLRLITISVDFQCILHGVGQRVLPIERPLLAFTKQVL